MSSEGELVAKLTTLNRIAETLNQAVDVRGVLDHALADLVELMGLETGWITLKDRPDGNGPGDGQYVLAAHHNLPPALDPDSSEAWQGSCTCRDLLDRGHLTGAYNEVHCSRLSRVRGDHRGLAVHASAPLLSADHVVGILNVAAPDWTSFSPQALGLLTNVGSQMGVALERARLYDLVQERRIHEQAALLHLSQQLLARRDLDDLMSYLVEELRQILRADACALLLPGEEPESLEFRACSGWRLDPCSAQRRVPADGDSGPGLVMHSLQPLLAEDIGQHDPSRWAPPWLQEEGFRGQALVPLVVQNRAVGVLVMNQRQPRLWHEDELRSLRLMANQAAIAVEKARLQQEEIRMKSLEKELEVGRQIQLGLLPDTPPTIPGWEFAAFYQAAREVGGDFYDFWQLPVEPEKLGLAIGDVTGKGVPAALFMARASTMIRSTALGGLSPSAALVQVNEQLRHDRRTELFITAFYGLLDTGSGRLVYANAGHTRPLWLQAAAKDTQKLAARGFLLGAMGGIELEERQVDLAPADLLILYTDGVTEAMDADHQIFGEERLRAVVRANAGGNAQQALQAIVDAVRAFTGDIAQSDDLTLLVVRRCSAT